VLLGHSPGPGEAARPGAARHGPPGRRAPAERASVLLADPPWRYEVTEADNRRIENQYPTATVEEIIGHIHDRHAAPPLAEDCILYLWATAPLLREALRVLEGWGFEYKTCATWDKEKVGMGYWFRGQHELLLVGVRGEVSPPEPALRISSVFREARTGQHSEKPECVYRALEAMFPDRVKGEMYQRKPRPGWLGAGNESTTQRRKGA
jgi:N6-adenosine-specific RNA methylase IME4